MDGTFLDEEGKFDANRFEQLLDELDRRGILFVVATGNQISRMKIVFGDFAKRLAYVVGNGSHLVVKDKTIYLKNLSSQQLQHFWIIIKIILTIITSLFHPQSIPI